MPKKIKHKTAVRRTPALTKNRAAKKPKPAAKSMATPTVVAAPAVEVVRVLPVELIADLRSPSAEVAVDAAAKLAECGDERVVAPLVAVLANADGFCHTVVRAAAAMALGRFDTVESRAALQIAATDAMAEVSREAVLALGTLKAIDAAATLTEIAANANGYFLSPVRLAAVRSLGRMKATAAQPTLAKIAISTTDDAALTAAARDALGQL